VEVIHYSEAPCLSGVSVLRVEHSTRLWTSVKEAFAFSWMISGRSQWHARRRVWDQTPGVLSLNQPGEPHRDVKRDGPCTFQVLAFSPTIFKGEHSVLESKLSSMPAQLRAGHPTYSALLDLQKIIQSRDLFAVENACVDALNALHSLAIPPPNAGSLPPEHRAIRRAKAYLREASLGELSMDALAEHSKLQKHYLSRVFRHAVGLAPYEFVIHLRVAKAKELLARRISVAEVAAEVGFCDQSQLHRHFVRITGVTPGRFAGHSAFQLRARLS
jgi:AraC-like DNA-binding protein